MGLWRIAFRSLRHYRRSNLALALGVAAATAVLTGALLVGDSVRWSLRQLTLDRLGRIDWVLATDRFFRQSLVDQLVREDQFKQQFADGAPVILFPNATVERKSDQRGIARAANVLVIGCDESFWRFGDPDVRPEPMPGPDQIVVNQPLADELGVAVGQRLVVRLPQDDQVPADSPLANKSERIRSLANLEVVAVVPARSLGRFSLRASQQEPRCAFLSRETLQSALRRPEQVNAVVVAGKSRDQVESEEGSDQAVASLHRLFRPSFDDYGFALKRVRQVAPGDGPEEGRIVFDYYSLTTDRLIFSPEAAESVARAYTAYRAQPVFTYLANAIQKVDASDRDGEQRIVPYSMIAAIDPSAAFPLQDMDGRVISELGENEIILNSWTADQLDARPGDRLRVYFFAPETTHGQAVERSAELTVKAVTPLTEPAAPYRRNKPAEYDKAPTLANDPDLTPTVEGVTDQETIDQWDPPFPFDYRRIRPADEQYWANHRTTPKAFVSLETGQRLWSSRFGRVTSFRIPASEGVTEEVLRERLVSQLARDGERLGFQFVPVKHRQLVAARGTTPFDGLFLALSFFVIVAALLLVALLFRLGIERRANQLGVLLSLGWPRGRAAGLFLREGLLVAALGALAGIAVGTVYAQAIVWGLRTWWVGAITTPFLQYHGGPVSLALGYLTGLVVCGLTIGGSIFRARRQPALRLLRGSLSAGATVARKRQWRLYLASLVLAAVSVGSLVAAVRLQGMEQAGAFVGGGAALLAALLLSLWGLWRRGGAWAASDIRLGLWRLAWRNAARHPSRSATTVALMASACFLIVSMSSFRMAPNQRGTGGFELIAECSQSVLVDLNDPDVREDLFARQAGLFEDSHIFGMRLRRGDDASCNNLYRPLQPRVLGVTSDFIRYFDDPDTEGFRWSSVLPQEEPVTNPWRLLGSATRDEDGPIPAVVDMNTAMYSLKPPVSVGKTYSMTDEQGRTITFLIVGLLDNSVLQGALLIGEADFVRIFPELAGYRYFLVDCPKAKQDAVRDVLEERLGDEGFDATPADAVLAQLLAVQNTYLSTFQSLGVLGLLLGTFGLATVQLRNVLERRGELALLRAAGFAGRRLSQLVLLENVWLLIVGLAFGTAAALLAVLPHKIVGDAPIPWSLLRDLAVMLATVLVVGVVASFLAARSVLRAPLIAALRRET